MYLTMIRSSHACLQSLIITLIGIIALSSCKPKTESTVHITDLTQVTAVIEALPDLPYEDRISCDAWENYAPYPENQLWFEEETIRLNFHCMYDSKGDKLLPIKKMRSFWIPELIINADLRLWNNPQMNLPIGNTTPALPPMLRYRRTLSEGRYDDHGTYEHIDDDLFYFLNKGKEKNNYSKEVINKYAIDDDHILNVFIMEVHPDSVASKTYNQHNAGIALGTSIKISGFYEEDPKWWEYAAMFNHEVGHIFGLPHAWTKYDGCDDTPPNPNCFSPGPPPCEVVSNNLMDYNYDQRAITPCQLGRWHRTIHDLKSKKRKLIEERWCHYKPNDPIIINEDMHWVGNKDLNRDIRVKSGATLRLSCRISMAAHSSLIVEEGGHLILDGVRLHNDCGDLWGGIKVIDQSIGKAISHRGINSIEDTVDIQS